MEFIRGKLTDVEREDLKIIFDGMMAKYMSRTEYTYIPSGFATEGTIHQQKPSRHWNKSGPKQQQSKQGGQPAEAKPTQEELPADLLIKVNSIEGMIQNAQTAYKSSNLSPGACAERVSCRWGTLPITWGTSRGVSSFACWR